MDLATLLKEERFFLRVEIGRFIGGAHSEALSRATGDPLARARRDA